MKRLTLTAAVAALFTLGAGAAQVDLSRAKAAAVAFMDRQAGVSVTVRDVQATAEGYYIFNMSPQGWAIVSADDVALPVLGYNATGSLSWHKLPVQMGDMLDHYSKQIATVRRSRAGLPADAGWAELSRPADLRRTRSASRADDGRVSPLIQVDWDQASPYNQLCPGNQSARALVGCVAVSMSQAMSVQRYPPRPMGTVNAASREFATEPINLDNEKPYDWDAIISGANNKIETARLLRDAGYAVHMDYGSEGSGVSTSNLHYIQNALIDNFSYGANDVKYYWRQTYSGNWEALILSEIQAGRAVVYNAVDRQGGYGHSFNIDGYDGQQLFHVNWGWGGYGNGNFRLDALRDDRMGMNYDSSHSTVIGIGSPDRVLRSLELSEDVIDENMAAGTVVGVITVNGEAPAAGYKFTARGPYNDKNGTYESVPFEVSGGNLVTTAVLTARTDPYEVTVLVEDPASGERLLATFSITVCKLRTLGKATSMTYDRATATFAFRTRNNTSYTLKGSDGSVIIPTTTPSPVPHFTISRSQLGEGDNTLVLTSGAETKTIIIKK